MREIIVEFGLWVSGIEPMILGALAIAATAAASLWVVLGLKSVVDGWLGSRKVLTRTIEVRAADDLGLNEVKLSGDLLKRLPWLTLDDQLMIKSLHTGTEKLFEHASRRNNSDGEAVFMHPTHQRTFTGMDQRLPRLELRHAAPLSIFKYLKTAFQSSARRSELILGFWFVIIGLALEGMLGIL